MFENILVSVDLSDKSLDAMRKSGEIALSHAAADRNFKQRFLHRR